MRRSSWYARTSLLGEWPERSSAVEAIFEEQRALNDIAAALGLPFLGDDQPS